MTQSKTQYAYVGIRRKGPSSWQKAPSTGYGLAIHSYDAESGQLTFLKTVAEDISVGAVFYEPRKSILYVLDEALTLPGFYLGGGGQVCAFAVDRETGDLTEINRQPSFGTLPCYAAWDTREEFLVVVNHTGHTPVTRTEKDAAGAYRIVVDYDETGTILYPLGSDGSIQPPCDIFKHQGHGAMPAQTHPQVHSVVRAPGHDFFVVCDKGSDRIHFFGLDREARRLRHHEAETIAAPPGSSPRYSVFHPNLPIFYVNFETAPLIHVYRYDEKGQVQPLQSLDLHADGIPREPKAMQSDLVIHASGKYLYCLVRGSESVAVYEIDQASGMLKCIQTSALEINNIRGAAISPDGRFFLVAAMLSNEVRAWRLDDTGRLLPGGTGHPVANPGCIVFAG